MKFDSPLFDKIRVKPSKDRRVKTGGPACEWHGCKETATHRAPKGRGSDKEYWHFCLAHVREYNQSYNFFAGMNDTGGSGLSEGRAHRPSPDLEDGDRQAFRAARICAASATAATPSSCSARACAPSSRRAAETRPVRNAERKALEVLSLEIGATPVEVEDSLQAAGQALSPGRQWRRPLD